MVIKHTVEGYEVFNKLIKNLQIEQGEFIYIYFSGSKTPEGISWCDDCVRAAPHIEKALEKVKENSHFIYCLVGDRKTWKDPDCSFRKDPKIKLMVLPTILRWNGPQKLEGDQCEKEDLLELLFTDED